MTPEIELTSKASAQPAVGALTPRARSAGHTEFEALLNLQLMLEMPKAGGSDRLKEQLEAQDRRGDERTGRAAAQQQFKGDGRDRARSSGAVRNAGERSAAQSLARADVASTSASANGIRSGTSETNSQNEPASAPAARPAQAALSEGDSAAKPSPHADRKDARGYQRNKNSAFGSLISSQASARSASAAGQSIDAVSSAKTGGSNVTQHGWSMPRQGGRAAAMVRGRPSSPATPARSFHLEQQKVLAQVGRGLAAALKREGGVVTLRLRPESLGELKIRVELNHGRVRAVFRADNDSARQLLETSLDALKSSLEAKGLRVDRLFVEPPNDLGHKQHSGSPSEPNDREQTPGGDREAADDGDRPEHSPGMAHDDAGSDPPADAEASVDQTAVSDARIAKDSTPVSGLDPGEDEILVRVRLDAVA